MRNEALYIVPSVKLWREGDYLIFDRKYYDGILKYMEYWGGPVRCVMGESNLSLPNFGTVRCKPDTLPFEVTVLENGRPVTAKDLDKAAIALVSGDSFDHFHLSKICRKLRVPCVFVIEYIPETRFQINRLSSPSRLVELRRAAFIAIGEIKRKFAFSRANGIQANGMAAFRHYQNARNAMVYFDTRVNSQDLAKEKDVVARFSHLDRGGEIRLAFSGRLEKMKGVDHLVPLARALRDRGVRFKLDIYGAGGLSEEISQEIAKASLSDFVTMKGVADFHSELLPALRDQTDLFVMLHRQSDPSCTYLETLSCGVPIVGYKNRAFSGILEKADVGWGVSVDDIEGAADLIASVAKDFRLLRSRSFKALEFSAEHSFDKTFHRRIQHLKSLVMNTSINGSVKA